MIIVQAPHTPRSQPRLLPVRSALLRNALSSVMRGSMFRFSRLPLTINWIATSPGPTTAAPVCASAAAAPATPATSGATPAVFRKLRRLRSICSRFSGSLFFRAMNKPSDKRGHQNPESIAPAPSVQLGGRIRFVEDRDELVESGDFVPGGVDDGPAFLQGWLRPALVFDVHTPITVDLDD